MTWPKHALRPLAAALGLAWGCAQAQDTPTQTVEVIGTAPLPGQGIDRNLLPYATQVLRREDLQQSGATHSSATLARSAAGVVVNDIQGSPYQGDLSFRGFRASGLLGAAQGLSVYLDGVRINEAFGDVVSWDLLPDFALDSLALVPGANPAFGLNTLGGAIALTTVDGRSAPGWHTALEAGSFGRRQATLSHGGTDGDWTHYLGLDLFEESGWRDFSPGRRGVLMGKLGLHTRAGDLGLTLLSGRSTLVGNGLVPLYTFEDPADRQPAVGTADRAAVYTHPDRTHNEATLLSLRWTRWLGDDTLLEALAYGRQARRTTLNGDEADGADDDDDGDAGGDDDGDGDGINASFNRTATRQDTGGLSVGLSGRRGAHRWQAGLSLDAAHVRYEQTEQAGVFNATRGVDAIDGADAELSADVRGDTRALGVHVSDTWSITPSTHLTGTLRWNHARVANTLTSVDDDTGELEAKPRESFVYRHLNPALGIAQRVGAVTLFANAARNTRVPTVIELGCADPDEPCRLPSGLQADPYLAPVRTTSLEAGLRFGGTRGHRGSLTFYRLDNRDDILFSSVSVTGQLGYFRNFERTRHQGLDAEWRWQGGAWDLGASYSHLRATYEADGVLRVGERNVAVSPGTPMAGLPRHALKAHVAWAAAPGWWLAADLQAVSRRTSAGNEDGRFDDDEEQTADFSVPGYAVLNLQVRWQPVKGIEMFLGVDNVFNRRSASFGALAETLFDAGGAYTGEEAAALFVAPGAPRSWRLGLRWAF
ncbi:MAG: TonB-dependent receptor [Rhodoferax sp.]|nr:TonB-dependent receptor [Rhodoferax sp.]